MKISLFCFKFIPYICKMDKERINSMVDKRISEAFRCGDSISVVQSDLRLRVRNFTITVTKDHKLEDLMDLSWEEIPTLRVRYGTFYIKHALKRIDDLDWMYKSTKLNRYSNSEIFNLIQLKEKLSFENSVPF
jgi:hypothetical protein